MIATLVWNLVHLVSSFRQCLPWIQQESSTSVRKQEDKTQDESEPSEVVSSAFVVLPEHIILEIMKCLAVKDVIALSKTNRALYVLSHSPSLWISQALTQLACSCPLVISPNTIFDSKNHVSSLSNLPHSAIRTAVLSASRLSYTWSRTVAAPTTEPLFTKLSELRDKPHCAIMRVTPRHVLVVRDDVVMGYGAQEVIGWDVQQDRSVGRVGLGKALLSVKPEWTTGSCYCVTVTCPGSDELEFAITHVQKRGTAAQLSDPISNTNNDPTSLIDESSTSTGIMTADILARFVMPNSVGIDVHILDVQARTAVVLFECGNDLRGRVAMCSREMNGTTDDDEPTTTLGLVIIFDWNTGMSAVIDTGIPFHHRTTSASLHLAPTCSRLLVCTERNIYVDEDASAGGHSVLRARQKLFDLDQLKRRAKSWDETIAKASKFAKLRNGGEVRWVMDGDAIRREAEVEKGPDMKSLSGEGGEQSGGMRVDYAWGDEAADALVGGSGNKVLAAADTHSVLAMLFGLLSRFLGTSPAQPQPRTPILEFDNSEIIRTWVMHEDWPSSHEIDGCTSPSTSHDDGEAESMQPIGAPTSARSSRISLYSGSPSHGPISFNAACGRIWYLVQSYVQPGESDATVPPMVVPFHLPVLVEGAFDSIHNPRARFMPLMSVSFNYACWLENAPEDTAASMLANEGGILRRELVPRRLLKLASFRGPEGARLKSQLSSKRVRIVSDLNGSGNEDKRLAFASVTTLDIPNGDTILRNARHLHLSETEGTVSIVSGLGGMYTYSFV